MGNAFLFISVVCGLGNFLRVMIQADSLWPIREQESRMNWVLFFIFVISGAIGIALKSNGYN
jgi:hypothetical protein